MATPSDRITWQLLVTESHGNTSDSHMATLSDRITWKLLVTESHGDS